MGTFTQEPISDPSDEKVQKGAVGVRLFTALIGAFGFGLEADRVIHDFLNLRAGAQTRWDEHILLGAMFLVMAIINSHLLLCEVRAMRDKDA